MKKIQLTQGQVALIDDEDFERVQKYKWYALWAPSGKCFVPQRTILIKPRPNRKNSTIVLSRFIMNAPKGLEVDHKNHDTLDNRKSNLRICTRYENAMNKRLRSDNKLRIKGVDLQKNGLYRAQIQKDKRKIILGSTFKTAQEAKKAYDKSAKKLFGKFHCLNERDNSKLITTEEIITFLKLK
jgi:hypothetical protein